MACNIITLCGLKVRPKSVRNYRFRATLIGAGKLLINQVICVDNDVECTIEGSCNSQIRIIMMLLHSLAAAS
jgi:hypothetical protein